MVKQIIIVRKDINMSMGKAIAQGAHASVEAVRDVLDHDTVSNDMGREIVEEWYENGHTKVVVAIVGKEALQKYILKAINSGIPCSLITDEGRTEFTEPTITCGAIGPYDAEKIDEITKRLRLY